MLPDQSYWQPSYEWRLIKARRCCEDARDRLLGIGASSRRGDVEDIIDELRVTEARIARLWEIHYGPKGAVT